MQQAVARWQVAQPRADRLWQTCTTGLLALAKA
jgi:hypothetical protein